MNFRFWKRKGNGLNVYDRRNQVQLINLIMRLKNPQYTVVLEKGDFIASHRGGYSLLVVDIRDRGAECKIIMVDSKGDVLSLSPDELINLICYSSQRVWPAEEPNYYTRDYWMYLIGNLELPTLYDVALKYSTWLKDDRIK